LPIFCRISPWGSDRIPGRQRKWRRFGGPAYCPGSFLGRPAAHCNRPVRPESKKEELWAFHQSLHCQGVGAVLCWPEKLDSRAFRSLQLAAESGGTVGLLIRSAEVRGHPTWSEVQLLVEACPGEKARRIRIEVIRCRTGKPGSAALVELDDETGILQTARIVPVAAELAAATTACGATGA
jgi:hypothetical protein